MAVSAAGSGLVERDREIEELRALAAAACGGEGAVAVIEAPAGRGKTALVRALRAEAAALGMGVLHAVGAELERSFSFGVVRQLLEGVVHEADPERRAELFAGAAGLAEPVFGAWEAADLGSDAAFGRLHGLYWLVANLAERGPLLLVVDDAHWGDAPSMRFLGVLARRLEGLPVLLAVAARPGEPGAEQDVLDDLAACPAARVLTPQPLSPQGVARVLAGVLGAEAGAAFVAAAAEATGGSPLLVRELVRTVEEQAFTGADDEVDRLRQALPGNVGRIVTGRLRRLSPDALAFARAVAVLGDGARPADAAALAGLPAVRAVEARVALSRIGFLRADELAFVHPVVREGVHVDLVGGARAEWHARAATLRAQAGADADELAAHLMLAEPAGADWAADALAAAGRRALLAGTPHAAAGLLRRAVAEPPAPAALASVLLTLGHAEARCGDEGALAHLERAAAEGDTALAAQADRLRAQVLLLHERAGESVEVLRRALDAARDGDPALADELEDDLVDVLAHHEPLLPEYRRHLEAAASGERPTVLAHLAFTRAVTGAPREEVLDLARRALAVRARAGRFMHYYAFEALMNVEAAAESEAALRDATALAQREGSRVVAGPLTYMTSSWAAWERAFGDLRRAEEQAREGLDLVTSAGAPAVVVTLRSTLAAVLLDRGRIDEADAEMALLPARETGPGLKEIHAIRARLRLAQGRHAEALAELDTELELERRRGWRTANRDPSRSTLVAVLLALGREEEARRAAEDELATAQRRGVAGAQARARLARALTLAGADAVDELRCAADVARGSPSRLIQAQALAELGSALRRAGDRVAAREPLARARELAHACGATGLERRAHEELVVAGAKPRRIALSGTDSLTAAERRVAELAAQGVRNRQIAETLFVSLKTVEVHLSRVYGKLGIKSRTQLADALGA